MQSISFQPKWPTFISDQTVPLINTHLYSIPEAFRVGKLNCSGWQAELRWFPEKECQTLKKSLKMELTETDFFSFLSTPFIPCWRFGSPDLGKAAAAARAALPISTSACGIFMCPNQGRAEYAWDL